MNQPYAPLPPVRFEFTHVVRLELEPETLELLHDFINPEESIPMTTTDFQAYLDGKIAEVKDKIKAEHDEVMAAVTAGGNATGDVPDSVKAALDGVFTQIADAVGGVFTPADGGTTPTPTTTPPPVDGGTVTTPPAGTGTTAPVDGGTVTPPTTPAGTTPPEGQPVPSTVAP